MKRFAAAAVSLITAMSACVSAQAAVNITGVSVGNGGAVSVSVKTDEAPDDMQYTILLRKYEEGTEFGLDDVIYIDQLTSDSYRLNGTTGSFDINFTVDTEGVYEIKIGATEAVTADSEIFGKGIEPGPTPDDKKYGDADQNDIITANDAALVLEKARNAEFEVKAALEIIDVNGDGEITAADSSEILLKVLNGANTFTVENK